MRSTKILLAWGWACVIAFVVCNGDSWPTYHGGSSLDGVAGSALPGSLVRLWRTKVGNSVAWPIVAGTNALYVANNEGQVVCLDMDGSVQWRTVLVRPGTNVPDTVSAPIVTTGPVVAAAGNSGTVYALDARDGRILWCYGTGDTIQGTLNFALGVEGRDLLFVLLQAEGIIHAVDLATGKKVWISVPLERCDGHMAVTGDKIVLGNCSAGFHVVSTAKGEKKGFTLLGEGREMAGGVCTRAGVAYAGNRSGSVAAARLDTAKIVWVNEDGEGEMFTTPAVDDRHVLFTSGSCVVFCLDASTGRKIWQFSADGSEPISPVIAGDKVLVADDGTLHILALKDGAKLWSNEVGDEVTVPAVVGGKVIVGTDDGHVVCFGTRPLRPGEANITANPTD